MRTQCEDCKFADWDYTLFLDYIKSKFNVEYHAEQFDVHCKRLNCFLVEDEIPGNCRFGEKGENNYHDICKCYYEQKKEYYDLLKQFRESRKDKEYVLINSPEEYELFIEYLKYNNRNLYNKFI